MDVDTVVEDRDCVFMVGYTTKQLHGAIGVAVAGIDEQVNVVVAALNRVPSSDRRKMADELMGEMVERLRWARAATGGAV